MHRTLANRSDRGHAGGPNGGPQARQQRDQRADADADQHRAWGEHETLAREGRCRSPPGARTGPWRSRALRTGRRPTRSRRRRPTRARPTPSTCLREAPSVRSVASSRIRCATVIASVFAITKLPTKSAMPPNASRIMRKMPMPSWLSWLSEAAWAVAVWTSIVSESSGSDLADELGLGNVRAWRRRGSGRACPACRTGVRPWACRRRRSSCRRANRAPRSARVPRDLVLAHRTIGERRDLCRRPRNAPFRRSTCRSRSDRRRAATRPRRA